MQKKRRAARNPPSPRPFFRTKSLGARACGSFTQSGAEGTQRAPPPATPLLREGLPGGLAKRRGVSQRSAGTQISAPVVRGPESDSAARRRRDSAGREPAVREINLFSPLTSKTAAHRGTRSPALEPGPQFASSRGGTVNDARLPTPRRQLSHPWPLRLESCGAGGGTIGAAAPHSAELRPPGAMLELHVP